MKFVTYYDLYHVEGEADDFCKLFAISNLCDENSIDEFNELSKTLENKDSPFYLFSECEKDKILWLFSVRYYWFRMHTFFDNEIPFGLIPFIKDKCSKIIGIGIEGVILDD